MISVAAIIPVRLAYVYVCMYVCMYVCKIQKFFVCLDGGRAEPSVLWFRQSRLVANNCSCYMTVVQRPDTQRQNKTSKVRHQKLTVRGKVVGTYIIRN